MPMGVSSSGARDVHVPGDLAGTTESRPGNEEPRPPGLVGPEYCALCPEVPVHPRTARADAGAQAGTEEDDDPAESREAGGDHDCSRSSAEMDDPGD